jgi:hypothetical protein
MTIAIQSIESFSDFVNRLEEVYKNQLIYRTLIVYGNKKNVSIYKHILEDNNNSVYVVNDKELNYDKLDYRILMVNEKKLKKFVEKNGKDFFNLVMYTPCSSNNKI